MSRFSGPKIIRDPLDGKYPIQGIMYKCGESYIKEHELSDDLAKVIRMISRCKTGLLGNNLAMCNECGYTYLMPCSCGNRNCPCCQAVNREIWVERAKTWDIDVPTYHVVATTPHTLNSLMLLNKKELYGLLQKSAADSVLEMTRDPKYLGVTCGIISVLHTWNQEMGLHPHAHMIVMAGGLDQDGEFKKLKPTLSLENGLPKPLFFLPVQALKDLFKGKFIDGLKKLNMNNKLNLPEGELRSEAGWKAFIDGLYKEEWVIYIKETFNGQGNALEYLGKYTNRIAISNQRIIRWDENTVTFSYRDSRDNNKQKEMTLPTEEFIRRFLMHVLPSGYQKIRYYGFLSNAIREKRVEEIFSKQKDAKRYEPRFTSETPAQDIIRIVTGKDTKCPWCGAVNSIEILEYNVPSGYTDGDAWEMHLEKERKHPPFNKEAVDRFLEGMREERELRKKREQLHSDGYSYHYKSILDWLKEANKSG